MLDHLATWLFGPPAADVASVNARFQAIAQFMIVSDFIIVGFAACVVWMARRCEQMERRLKRQEEYLRRATAAMHRSGVVTDDIEIESVEAK